MIHILVKQTNILFKVITNKLPENIKKMYLF